MRNVKLWTKEEEDELLMLIAQGKTNEQIAAKLGRTKSAVAHKRGSLFKEDPDGEGGTEIERELNYVQELLDEAVKTINANAGILEKNMAAMMERTNELSKEKTVMEDRLTALEKRVNNIAEDLSTINIYLSLGPVYRLFHSFRKFREGRQNG